MTGGDRFMSRSMGVRAVGELPFQPKWITEIQTGPLCRVPVTIGIFGPELVRQQIVPDAERGILLHKRLQTLPADIIQAGHLEKMLDYRLQWLIHRTHYYQLEKSLLKISSVRLLMMVGISCCSASVILADAEKSKFLDTSVSKSAGATFF